MTPSELNGYLPTLITDGAGKAVLSSQYAAAARAAGIPQEGLGCLPSSDLRNKFLQGLADSGVISQNASTIYQGIQYAQSMGMGTTDLVTTTVKQMTLSQLLEYYESGEAGDNPYIYNNASIKAALESNGASVNEVVMRAENGKAGNLNDGNISLSSILTGEYQILCKINNEWKNDRGTNMDNVASNIASLDIWTWMFDEFEAVLNVAGDSGISEALAYAESQTRQLLSADNLAKEYSGKTKENKDDDNWSGVLDAMNGIEGNRNQGFVWDWFRKDEGSYSTSDYIGIATYHNTKSAKNNRADGVSISITNIAYAYLTYFAQAMQGLSKSDYSVDSTTGNRTVENSNLISLDDESFLFDVVVDTGVNTDQALISGFYDTIFNQICTRGWTENNQIQDNEYMQEMLKSGKFFLATCSDDGYYYQGNYSTNTYVREVTDEEAIAKAEAKYNTEKQKLNQKEEVLDLKMKNLDTEISSLTTEYDTVKSVISKNIEKSFKRYDA